MALPFKACKDVKSDYSHGQQVNELSIFNKPSVVIYRATPSQKGRIAAFLVKSGRSTLSIGDGNNDVAMLKDSHVGVGIMGKEGTQAALSADFAIPQFRNLKNLILIHGRYSFLRYTKIALNSYYKNIVFIVAQFMYNLYSGASASPLYNSFTLNYYNLFFTSMIPFSVVLFDRDVTPSFALNQPSSYRHIRNHFDKIFIVLNIFFAVFEALVVFFGIRLLTLNDITNGSGILGAYASISTIFSIIVIYTVVLRQIRQISYRVFFTDIAIALTIILNIVSIFVIQELYNRSNYTIYYLLSMPYFYFICICLCTLIYSADTVFENVCLYLEDRLKMKN
ncbi:HAD ATPase, P-type, family IC [Vittaforma corneae ATCC 50505]|uniref:HAD ATPase, P-type, family IC n=1 Tax=Vittaforma corneae (strain ATCC 50505) TaxID=993615 RepID=L2GKX4_VITCO|nr:HAD ATPase, P-type, family IC [Vittaforma corneae ATCC 50505]ELA41506.1 HAD ATPase, P-type, family IC [Vittaforma corneae ATCC 50505]